MELFFLRRAIERLRDGLFDSAALSCLTIEPEQVVKSFYKGLKQIEKGEPAHLCICGSYGQGKSHTLNYLRQQALTQGYAVSLVQIDVREVPFYQFSVVYQSFIDSLALPDGKSLIEAWQKWSATEPLEQLAGMPYRFEMVLKAMAANNRPAGKKKGDEESSLCMKEASESLELALKGRNVPLSVLKQIIRSRGVQERKKKEGQAKESLLCKGNLPYVEMIKSLASLLKKMGYNGLVLFFDEAEAIAQARASCRAKSYEILQELFYSQTPLYPIFAFTDSFFDRVNSEEYEKEQHLFAVNYAEGWKNVNLVRLKEPTAKEWEALQHRLIDLYGQAYRIDLSCDSSSIKKKLQALLDQLQAQETRFKLKALVNQLDIETQSRFLPACN